MKFPGKNSGPERARTTDSSLESGGYEIVELSAENWQELRDLRLQALRNAPRAYGRTYEEEAGLDESEWRRKFNTGRYFCAREGDKLIGMICMVRERGEKVDHIVNVYSVYVAPEARGRGVAKALFGRLLTEASDGTARKIRLRVDTENEAATGLYKSMGFEQVGLLKEELKQGDEFIDEAIMEKRLV